MKKAGILILSCIFLVGVVSRFDAIQGCLYQAGKPHAVAQASRLAVARQSHTVYREDLLRLCYENYEYLEYNGMQLPEWYGGTDNTGVNKMAIKLVKGWRIDPLLLDKDGYIKIADLEYDAEKNRLYDNATGKRYNANRYWAECFTDSKYRISIMYTEISFHDLIQMYYMVPGVLQDNDIEMGSVSLNYIKDNICVEIQNKEDLPRCAEVLKEACEKVSKSAFDYIELSVGTNMPFSG